MKPEPKLTEFIPAKASNGYFASRHLFLNTMRAELHPDDPSKSLESTINNARGWSEIKDGRVFVWDLWLNDEIVAELFAPVMYREANRHMMDAEVEVLPAYRRRGLTYPLLTKLADVARANERRLITFETVAKVPAGAILAEKLGAVPGLEESENRLVLAHLDYALLKDWQTVETDTARDFDIAFTKGDYPDDLLNDMVRIAAVMNSAPRGDLDIEDDVPTAERARQWEAYARAQGLTRWTCYVRHRSSGDVAGYTEMIYEPDTPETLFQAETGVLPEYRGRGLGRWLKAAMLERVLAAYPDVKYIRTGNANVNTPMLKINRALGFKPYLSATVWQLQRSALEAYLTERSKPV